MRRFGGIMAAVSLSRNGKRSDWITFCRRWDLNPHEV